MQNDCVSTAAATSLFYLNDLFVLINCRCSIQACSLTSMNCGLFFNNFKRVLKVSRRIWRSLKVYKIHVKIITNKIINTHMHCQMLTQW